MYMHVTRWRQGFRRVPLWICTDGAPAFDSMKLPPRVSTDSTGPSLPAKVGSEAATCPVAPNPASLLGRTPVPPRV
jgi:hypothetical protein